MRSGRATRPRTQLDQTETPIVSRAVTNSSPDSTPAWSRSTSVSAPAAGPARDCCRAGAAVRAGSRSTSGEMARIAAAADDEVLRCPECGAILLRVKGFQA